MKTLRDYIKGYGRVPIILIAEHKAKDGTRYCLCKQDGYNSFYFMKGEEVIKKEYIHGHDEFEKLALKFINSKGDPKTQELIKIELGQVQTYNMFKKFIKDQCGEEFKL